jgi:hypothetical protein
MKTRHIAVGMKAKYYSKDPEQRDIIKDGVVTGVFNDGTEECVVVEDDYYNKLETEPHPVEIVPVKRILAVTKGYTNFEVEGPGGRFFLVFFRLILSALSEWRQSYVSRFWFPG